MTDRHVLQRKMPGVLGVGLAGYLYIDCLQMHIY